MNPPSAPASKRPLRHCKSIAWILLFTGVGTVLFYAMLTLHDGFQEVRREWQVFATALVLIALSAALLKWSYRVEPADFSGFWQLSLADLLAASFFTALLMTAFRAVWPEDFLRVGIFATLVLGLGFAFCLLLAARKGCAGMGLKSACAFGTFITVVGSMSSGFFLFIVSFFAITENRRNFHESVKVVLRLVYLEPTSGYDSWIFNLFRIGFLFLPVGYALRKYVEIRLGRAKHDASGIEA